MAVVAAADRHRSAIPWGERWRSAAATTAIAGSSVSCYRHRSPHGMAEREDRRRAIGQDDLAHDGFEIDGIIGKIADITLASILERALRKSLSAPIKARDRKAARAQIAHTFEIFLDEFGAALQQEDRSFAARGRRPAGDTQPDAVGCLDVIDDHVLWHRIGGNGYEFHGGKPARNAPYSRSAGLLNRRDRRGHAGDPTRAGRGHAARLARREPAPHIPSAQAFGCARRALRSGLWRTTRMSLNRRTMPCEISILLRFIGPPSASIGCSRCSTRLTAPPPAIRPTISNGPAKTTIASPSPWPASARTSFRSRSRRTR